MKCINISHPEYRALKREVKKVQPDIPDIILEIYVSKWQTNNNTDDFPSVSDLPLPSNNTVVLQTILNKLGLLGKPLNKSEIDAVNNEYLEMYGVEEGVSYGFEKMDKIVDESVKNSETLLVWNKIKDKVRESNVDITFERTAEPYQGFYNPGTNGITIDINYLNGGRTGTTIVHEAIHAVSIYQLNNILNREILSSSNSQSIVNFLSKENKRLLQNYTQEQIDAVRELNDLYLKTKEDVIFGRSSYGFTNVAEFVAELSNPDFVSRLKRTSADGYNSIYDKIIFHIKRLLGFDTNNVYDAANKALDHLLESYSTSIKDANIEMYERLEKFYQSKLANEGYQQVRDTNVRLSEQDQQKVDKLRGIFKGVHVFTNESLDGSARLVGKGTKRYKQLVEEGKIEDGQAVIEFNPMYMRSDTVYHEFAHIYIDLVLSQDLARFNRVVESLKNSPIWNEVLEKYPELDEFSFQKEVVATAMGRISDDVLSESQKSKLQRFIDFIINRLSRLLNLDKGVLKNNLSVKGAFKDMMSSEVIDVESMSDLLHLQDQFSKTKYTSSTDSFISDITDHSNAVFLDDSINEDGTQNHDYYFTTKDGEKIKIPASVTEKVDDPTQYTALAKTLAIEEMLKDGMINSVEELEGNPELQASLEGYIGKILKDWNKKAEIGTFLHKRAEDILGFNKVDDLDPNLFDETTQDTIQMFDDFIRGIRSKYHGKTFTHKGKKKDRYKILSEVRLYDAFNKVAGTIDLLIFDNKTGRISLFDFKSTNKDYYNSKEKKEKVVKQLRAYEIMLKNIFGVSVEETGVFPIQYKLNENKKVESITSVPNISNLRMGDNLSSIGLNTRTVENYTELLDQVEDAGIKFDPKMEGILNEKELQRVKDSLNKTRKILIRKLDSIEVSKYDKSDYNKRRRKEKEEIETIINEIDNIKQESDIINLLVTFKSTLEKIQSKYKNNYYEFTRDKKSGELIELSDNASFNRITKDLAELDLILSLSEFKNIVISSNIIKVISKTGDFEVTGIGSGNFRNLMDVAGTYHEKLNDLLLDKLTKTGVEKTHYGTVAYRNKFEKEFYQKNPNGTVGERRDYIDKKLAEISEEIYDERYAAVKRRLKNIPRDIMQIKSFAFDPKIAGNNIYMEMALKLLDESDRDVQLDTLDMQKELSAAINNYIEYKKKSGVDITTDSLYDEFIVKDKSGKKTEYLITEFDSNLAIEHREIVESELSETERKILFRDFKNKYASLNSEGKFQLKSEFKNKEWEKKFSDSAPDTPTKRLYQVLMKMMEVSEKRVRYSGKPLTTYLYGTTFMQIPSISKSRVDRITAKRAGDAISRINNAIKDTFTTQTDDVGLQGAENSGLDDNYVGIKQDIYGDRLKEIPVYFRGRLADTRKKHLEEISYDLGSSIMMNYITSSNYHFKQRAIHTLEALQYLANKEDSRTVPAKGIDFKFVSRTAKKRGEENLDEYQGTIHSSESNWYKQFQGLINDRLYGIQKLDDQLNVLGKTVSAQKITGVLLGYTGTLGMAVNLPASATNVLNGVSQRIIEGVGGRFFSMKDLEVGFTRYNGDFGGIITDVGKIDTASITNLLGEMFDINHQFKGVASAENAHLNTKLKYMMNGGPGLNFLQESGEHYLQHMLMYSVLNQYKVKNEKGEYIDKNGKVVKDRKKAMTLDQAFDIMLTVNRNGKEMVIKKSEKQSGDVVIKNPYLQLKDIVRQVDGIGVDDIQKLSTEELNQKFFLRIQNYIKAISFNLDGQYDTKLQSSFQRYWVGRLFMIFRKWIFRMTNNRWENITNVGKKYEDLTEDNIRYDVDLESEIEGYYVSALRYGLNYLRDVRAGSYDIRARWNELNHMQRSNIMKALTEGALIGGLLLMGMLFSKLLEGGDDDDKELLYTAAMLTRRLYTEYSFFSASPFTVTEKLKILKSPFASITTTNDLVKLFEYTVSRERYVSGDDKGELKAWNRLEKLVPVYKQFQRNPKDYYEYLTSDFGGF